MKLVSLQKGMSSLIDYIGLTKTDFFSFFNITETNRAKTEEGIVRISLKPGGFQEHIDIEIKVDEKGSILRADLFLDRDWIGDWKKINPFGKDIAKSFIECLYTKHERSQVRDLVSAIWRLKGVNDEVISFKKGEESEDSTKMRRATDVYTGKEKLYTMMLSQSEIIIENLRQGGRERLRITISSF